MSVQRNHPALLDRDVLKRAESLCGRQGLCSWDDHGPICCDSPPGNILGARDDKNSLEERGRADHPAPFEKDDSDGEEVVDADTTDEDTWANEAIDGKFFAVCTAFSVSVLFLFDHSPFNFARAVRFFSNFSPVHVSRQWRQWLWFPL